MLTVLSRILPFLLMALPVFSAPPPFLEFRCRGLFNEMVPLDFPEGWPLAPDQAQQIYDLLAREDRQTMWRLAQFAEFVDSLSPVLWDELGISVSFDLVATFQMDEIPFEDVEAAKRFYQFLTARNILLGKKTVPPQLYQLVRLLAEQFGGAPPTQPWRGDRLASEPGLFLQLSLPDHAQGLLAAFKNFYDGRASRLPPVGSFLHHSSEALFFTILYVLNSENLSPTPKTIKALQTLIEKSAKGQSVSVPAPLRTPFNAIERFVKDSAQSELHKTLFFSSLIELTAKFYESFAARSTEPKDLFETYHEWGHHLQNDMITDQGWQPFLKSVFVEVLMKRPALTGEKMKFLVRSNVEHLIRTRTAPLWEAFGLDKEPEKFH